MRAHYITILTDLFQKLFRQDLLVASMFRNFLLAERIMRTYKCSPESHPPIPSTYNHPMWAAWDLALDHIARQLPDLVENKAPYEVCPYEVPPTTLCVSVRYVPMRYPPPLCVCVPISVCVLPALSLSFLQSSQFFAQQLGAFQVWLVNCSQSQTPPQQLPIVLQVYPHTVCSVCGLYSHTPTHSFC